MPTSPELIPLCAEDKGEFLENFFTTVFLGVDRVLPQTVEELEKSLVNLLRKPGWNKLAYRLVGDPKKLELFHKFTETTYSNPVNFTSVTHSMSIASHPLASNLPTPTSTLSLTPPLNTFRSLFQHENCCISFVDLQKRGDYPPTSAHVTIFEDATLIGLTLPHNIADMMTMSLLLKAWLTPKSVEDLLPVCAVGDTPLNMIGDEKDDRHFSAVRAAKGWELTKLKLWTAWDVFKGGVAEESKLFQIPGEFVRQMRALADQELVKDRGEWVSDHDLVVALALKILNPALTSTSSETFTLHRSLSAHRWASSLFESSTFLGNAMSYLITEIPVSQLVTLSVPRLALILRQSLQSLCTPETEIHRCLRALRTFRKANDGSSRLCWSPPAVSCTSWVAAGLDKILEGTKWCGGWLDAPNMVKIHRYSIAVAFRDSEGGYAIAVDKPLKQWREIEKAMEEFNTSHTSVVE